MQFQRLGPVGVERPAVRTDEGVFDLSPIAGDINGAFLADDGLAKAAAALAAGQLPALVDAENLRVGAPVARPGAVICIGQNYAAHAAESGSPPPGRPIVFFKHPNTVIGPNDDVTIPADATQVDWEVELGVVIGRTASRLGAGDDPLSYVAGYLVGNDVSERVWQAEHSIGQWSKGKCAPTFCPLGPSLVPAADVDPTQLSIRSFVNGEPRQDSHTSDMIFDVATIVRDLSQYMQLDPGDVVLTGTPEGVALSGRFPFIADGDVVEVEVEGLGRQRQTFVKAAS